MSTVALRTALIWHDEVMEDVVLEKPAKVTLGGAGKPMFVIPELGLPKDFAIVRPGNRGYLLTLGEHMRGTLCIDGEEKDVSQLVRAGEFFATPISGRDWGVIELDGSGAYKLFFQFVPVEDHQPFFSAKVLAAGAAGYFGAIVGLALLFYSNGVHADFSLLGSDLLGDLAECAARGATCSTIVLAGFGVLAWIVFEYDLEAQMSLIFSVMLHTFLLWMTYQLYDRSDPFVWPGPRDRTGEYLAARLQPEEEPPKPPPTAGEKKVEAAPSAPKTPEKPKNTATKNDQGAAGGKGEHERARDKNNKNDEKPAAPKVALLDDKNSKAIENLLDRNNDNDLSRFMGMKGDETRRGDLGFGKGTGTGVGLGAGTGTTRGSKGRGSGGGGGVENDFQSKGGKIDTGTARPGGGSCATPPCGTGPKKVEVSVGEAEGDIEGLTKEEINRVVKARAGVFRSCYQKELNRTPGLGGKLVMKFVIGGDGVVKSAKTAGGSTLRNDAVEECVQRQINNLRFPAKGGQSNVNYPFVFQPGG